MIRPVSFNGSRPSRFCCRTSLREPPLGSLTVPTTLQRCNCRTAGRQPLSDRQGSNLGRDQYLPPTRRGGRRCQPGRSQAAPATSIARSVRRSSFMFSFSSAAWIAGGGVRRCRQCVANQFNSPRTWSLMIAPLTTTGATGQSNGQFLAVAGTPLMVDSEDHHRPAPASATQRVNRAGLEHAPGSSPSRSVVMSRATPSAAGRNADRRHDALLRGQPDPVELATRPSRRTARSVVLFLVTFETRRARRG